MSQHPTFTSDFSDTLATNVQIPEVETSRLSSGLVWRIFTVRPLVRLGIISLACLSALCGLLGPYFQKLFVDAILKDSGANLPTERLILYISLAFIALLASQTLAVACKLVCSREGVLTNRWLSRSLYQHGLKLSQASRRSRPTGEFVNIFSQDVSAITMMIDELLPVAVMSFIPFIAAPVAVGFYFSLPPLPLAAVSTLSLTLLFVMAYRQSGFFIAFKRLATERLAVVNEWLQNIRILRILGWTELFEEKIFDKRRSETVNRLAMVTNGSGMSAFAQVAPSLISITGIASVVFTHTDVTPGEIFALLWVLSIFLSRPIRSLPFNLVMFLDGLSSARRLQTLFAMPLERGAEHPSLHIEPLYALDVKGLELTLDGVTLIKRLDLRLKKGEFVAIIGEVGAGKSLLLDSLLCEAPATFESYTIEGIDVLPLDLAALRAYFAYAPQEGFIMSSTLRDNVVFEYGASADKDEAVSRSLGLAAFALDSQAMSGGLDTEIGERGVNLSGGQRQRVSLARAHYNDRPIVLLDDCLSAVDVDTERLLLDGLIEGAWTHKTRLLVTHRLSVLPRVDRVLVMHHGAIQMEGTFDELMANSEEFRDLTRSMQDKKKSAPAQEGGNQV
ncbi:MAG: ABC transporter ATP-binding protein [Chitinophagaceae bacterium]|nr:ABC transporter ATP-binding protein [Oligoflexus sp.]